MNKWVGFLITITYDSIHYLIVEISIATWFAGNSLSGVSSTLTLRTDRESSLSVVDETAPEP